MKACSAYCRVPAKALILAVVVMLLATPAGLAGLDGTEEEPELRDAEGDIAYAATDLAKASNFLDIIASWLTYDPLQDRLLYHLKVADAAPLKEPQRDPYWRCKNSVQLAVGNTRTGLLSIQWSKTFGGVNVHSTVVYYEEETNSAAREGTDVPHNFTFVPDKPGYFEWAVPREYLQNQGAQVSELRLRCSELQYMGTVPTGGRNVDDASAPTSFDLTQLSPAGGTTVDAETGPNVGPAASDESGVDSPALGMILALAALSAGVFLPRRRLRQ